MKHQEVKDNEEFEIHYENITNLVDTDNQNWLFGAGISFDAGIPLMYPLTELIEDELDSSKDIYNVIKESLVDGSHIEHVLSHVGDLLSLIERTKDKQIIIANNSINQEVLTVLYSEILIKLTELIRYGYDKSDKTNIGKLDNPMVSISYHLKFIDSLLKNHLGIETRRQINFYTTNYDTLLEDALVLRRKVVVDGFSGGAMGFWNPDHYSKKGELVYPVYKLHGSIDWFQDQEYGLIRTRYGTNYTSDTSRVLIYPQATKYIETQKDPFATIFQKFRKDLNKNQSKLFVCGYSFGDNHINNEIFNSLVNSQNNSTLIVFVKEIPEVLNNWQKNPDIKDRVYCMTEKGIHYKNNIYSREDDRKYDWWSFTGLTDFLNGKI